LDFRIIYFSFICKWYPTVVTVSLLNQFKTFSTPDNSRGRWIGPCHHGAVLPDITILSTEVLQEH